jgi:hypothetical protein
MKNATLRNTLILGIICANPCLSPAVTAGPAADTRRLAGGAGDFMIGGSALDLTGLNSALSASGYSSFRGSFGTIGGGGHATIGRLVLGGEGQAYLARSGGNALFATSLAGGAGFFDIGWLACAGRGFRIFPLVGLGAGSLRLDINGRSAASFGEVVVDPQRSAHLQTSGFLLNLALAVEKWFGGPGRRGTSGFFVGLRAGYVLAPARSGWELDRTEIEGGPKLDLGGPYLRLVIGAGSSGINQ